MNARLSPTDGRCCFVKDDGGRRRSADHGVADEVYGPYLEDLGWRFTSTNGKGVHLRADDRGRLIVLLPRHLVAVVDGVIHDTHDCSNEGRPLRPRFLEDGEEKRRA